MLEVWGTQKERGPCHEMPYLSPHMWLLQNLDLCPKTQLNCHLLFSQQAPAAEVEVRFGSSALGLITAQPEASPHLLWCQSFFPQAENIEVNNAAR